MSVPYVKRINLVEPLNSSPKHVQRRRRPASLLRLELRPLCPLFTLELNSEGVQLLRHCVLIKHPLRCAAKGTTLNERRSLCRLDLPRLPA